MAMLSAEEAREKTKQMIENRNIYIIIGINEQIWNSIKVGEFKTDVDGSLPIEVAEHFHKNGYDVKYNDKEDITVISWK